MFVVDCCFLLTPLSSTPFFFLPLFLLLLLFLHPTHLHETSICCPPFPPHPTTVASCISLPFLNITLPPSLSHFHPLPPSFLHLKSHIFLLPPSPPHPLSSSLLHPTALILLGKAVDLLHEITLTSKQEARSSKTQRALSLYPPQSRVIWCQGVKVS